AVATERQQRAAIRRQLMDHAVVLLTDAVLEDGREVVAAGVDGYRQRGGREVLRATADVADRAMQVAVGIQDAQHTLPSADREHQAGWQQRFVVVIKLDTVERVE